MKKSIVQALKISTLTGAMTIMTAIALLLNPVRVFAADVLIDTIVAVVNEGVVLASELESEVDFLTLQARSNNQNLPEPEVFRERVLERMIDQQIQRQHASDLGIVIDASTVNQAVEQVAQGNNMSLQQFRQLLTDEGFNYNYYRRSIEHELLLNRLIQRDVQSRIRVSTQEIDDFISASNKSGQNLRYRVQHILIAVAPSAAQAEVDGALAKSSNVLAKLRSGQDFAQVAASDSDGARALEGGDLGWRELQELPDFLSNALVDMSVGDISEPLRSQNGFHIVKLLDKSDDSKAVRAETLARHIFVASESNDGQQKLAEVRQRILAGEDFAALALEVSEDPNSSTKGGELPWFSQGQMPETIENVAGSLESGAVSEPFRTQFGWHILEVLERRQRDTNNDTQRAEAEQALRQRKIEQETERWIRRLRDESFIEVRG